MENISTKEFCREFDACREGTKFALKFGTMRDCYAALLSGEAGNTSATWALWTITRTGVMSDRDLRLFAVRCARRIQHLMTDERSVTALDVAERYANGEATTEELKAARDAACDAMDAACDARDAADAADAACDATKAAAWAAACDAACVAAWAAAWAAVDAADAAMAAERKAQLDILKEFGNPFEDEEK